MNMSNHRNDPSHEWMKHQTDDFWDDWMRYETYRFAESIVDALDEASAEKKQKRDKLIYEIVSDKEAQKGLGIFAVGLWVFIIVLLIIAKLFGIHGVS